MSDYLGRDVEAEKQAGVDAFDESYFLTTPPSDPSPD